MGEPRIHLSNMEPDEEILDSGPAKCGLLDRRVPSMIVDAGLDGSLKRLGRTPGALPPMEARWGQAAASDRFFWQRQLALGGLERTIRRPRSTTVHGQSGNASKILEPGCHYLIFLVSCTGADDAGSGATGSPMMPASTNCEATGIGCAAATGQSASAVPSRPPWLPTSPAAHRRGNPLEKLAWCIGGGSLVETFDINSLMVCSGCAGLRARGSCER